ncbi:MAG: hypothetical protein L0Y60_11935 [Beijerinckiaceae bacterium]|nr:hypothetical protein [Beijerinckiaceae bacterium]
MIDRLVGSAPLVSHIGFFVVLAVAGFVCALVFPVFKKYFGVAGLVAAAVAFTLHVGARDMKRYMAAQEAHTKQQIAEAVKKQAAKDRRIFTRRPPAIVPRPR